MSNLGCPDKIGSTSINKVSLEEVFFSDFHGTKKNLKECNMLLEAEFLG